MANEGGEVLVVGGTGDVGGRVIRALLARGKRVRALVRPGSDASALEAQGVAIVRGDLTDASSLDRALHDAAAVVTSAAGYMGRRKGDSLQTVDDAGNRNLVDAAKRATVPRFVFTSILTADKAEDVPHFWQKKLIEDYLEASGVPYVSLRPGAFLGGGSARFFAKSLPQGKLMPFAPPDARYSWIHPDDVARCIALAVDEPRAVGRTIDLGSDRAVDAHELARLVGDAMGRPVRLDNFTGTMFRGVGTVAGMFSERMRDMIAMVRYFETGLYVADTTAQAELFGPVPTMEETVRKMLVELRIPVQG
jgi:uncharacterized protein YbjT (DUF2867 family)